MFEYLAVKISLLPV